MLLAKNKKADDSRNQCKFCGKRFVRDSTLATHICIKKQRHNDIDTQGSRFGFQAFQKYYDLTTTSKKAKTIYDFIDSPYYVDFAKFGNHLARLKPLYIDLYIEFVIKGQIKLKDWCKDDVYYLYVEDFVFKEPAISATERTIEMIMKWSEENKINFVEYFGKVNANEAAYLIQTGRISPWVLYLSETGGDLLSRFNADHNKMIRNVVDASRWKTKFKKNEDDVAFIQDVLEQVGL